MYAKASPFSLALAMLVRDQVLTRSLLSELKELSQEQESLEGLKEVVKWLICLDKNFRCSGSQHLQALDFLSI